MPPPAQPHGNQSGTCARLLPAQSVRREEDEIPAAKARAPVPAAADSPIEAAPNAHASARAAAAAVASATPEVLAGAAGASAGAAAGAAESIAGDERNDELRILLSEYIKAQSLEQHNPLEPREVMEKLQRRKEKLQSLLYEALQDESRLTDPSLMRKCPEFERAASEAEKLRAAIKALPDARNAYLSARQASRAVGNAADSASVADEWLRRLLDMLDFVKDGCWELLCEGTGDDERCVLRDAFMFGAEIPSDLRSKLDLSLDLKLQLWPDLRDRFRDVISSTSTENGHDSVMSLLLPGRGAGLYTRRVTLSSNQHKVVLQAMAPGGKSVVLKRFDLGSASCKSSDCRSALRELRLLDKLKHVAGVLNLEGFFLSDERDSFGFKKRFLTLQLPYFALGTLKDLHAKLREEVQEKRLGTLRKLWHALAVNLAFIHSLNVVHRDVKPSNVLIEQRDGTLTPVLADFELGRDQVRSAQGLTSTFTTNGPLGTAGYRAPPEERDSLLATPLGAADVWALGAIAMYEIFPHLQGDLTKAESKLHKIASAPDGSKLAFERLLPGVSDELQPFVELCHKLLFERPPMAEVVDEQLLLTTAPPPHSQAGPSLVAAIHAYEGEQPAQHGTRGQGSKFLLPYRMADGASGRVSELTLLRDHPELRKSIAALHLEEAEQTLLEGCFESRSTCRKAIDDVIKQVAKSNTELKRRRDDDEDADTGGAGEELDTTYLSLKPFWDCFKPERRAALERALRALCQQRVFRKVRELKLMAPSPRTPTTEQQLLQQFPVEFEGENDALDWQAVHAEMIALVCTVFGQRYLRDGLVDDEKLRLAKEVEEQIARLKPRSAAGLCTLSEPSRDFEAMGRLMLHCKKHSIATALGLMPLVYAAALVPELCFDELLDDPSKGFVLPTPKELVEQQVGELMRVLEPHLEVNDSYLNSLRQCRDAAFAPEFDEFFDQCAGIEVDEQNYFYYQLLKLRRRIFGHSPSPRRDLFVALAKGLGMWSEGILAALRDLLSTTKSLWLAPENFCKAAEDLCAELEGRRTLSASELMAKIQFQGDDHYEGGSSEGGSSEGGSSGRMRRWLRRALEEPCPDTQKPALDTKTMLAWLTSYRALNRDNTLRPCKREPHRTHIEITISSNNADFVTHTCFYTLDAPRFETYEAFLLAIQKAYTARRFDMA